MAVWWEGVGTGTDLRNERSDTEVVAGGFGVPECVLQDNYCDGHHGGDG